MISDDLAGWRLVFSSKAGQRVESDGGLPVLVSASSASLLFEEACVN